MVTFQPEIPAYDLHDHQSTDPTGGCGTRTDLGTSVTNSYSQVRDTPRVRCSRRPRGRTRGAVGVLTYRIADALLD